MSEEEASALCMTAKKNSMSAPKEQEKKKQKRQQQGQQLQRGIQFQRETKQKPGLNTH